MNGNLETGKYTSCVSSVRTSVIKCTTVKCPNSIMLDCFKKRNYSVVNAAVKFLSLLQWCKTFAVSFRMSFTSCSLSGFLPLHGGNV